MIKFFRRIRQKLLEENRFSKYLLYAIGEITLVMIGILLALQVNNWNEARKNSINEQLYLINIRDEVAADSTALHRTWFQNYPKKVNNLHQTKQYITGDYALIDTLAFIDAVGFGGVGSRSTFYGSSRTYQELISTGNLSLISSEKLRQQIVEYFDGKEFVNKYANNIRTPYADYVNSFKYFNSKFPDSINKAEIPRMLKKIKTDEFYGLINQELTYAYSIHRALERNKQEAHQLYDSIQKFLSK
ncbi:DUF6090 family protein [Croceivirga thetidis]|uniref:ABC transporter permease n=1 Tax=Croceivirga thetidis TaxID=2721623 RepID=A0ABX1GLY9_9FLAO|nr:DUF6090 family protein [Croceivirga thetidis]NKI30937.1 hypothetical protein [Croceivirga thetidis]